MNQNATINWAPSAAYQNRSKVLKYMPKVDLVNEVKAAQSALAEWDKEPEATSADAMTKAALYSEYERLVTLYKTITTSTETVNAPAETAADSTASSSPAAPEKAERGRDRKADARERLERYGAELAEKEAALAADEFSTKEEHKACVKRVASLKRKIARANRALERTAK